MYCRNCGKQLDDQASVCTNCGVATSNHVQHKSETNTIAIIGFILSFFISIAGLICSIVGYRNAKYEDKDGKGMALAGIIISSIKLAGEVFLFIFYVSLIIAAIVS